MAASDLALLRELLALRVSNGSALLDVQTGDLTTTLVIEAGELVGATAPTPGEARDLVLRVFQSAAVTWTKRPLPADRNRISDELLNIEEIVLDAVQSLDDARKGELQQILEADRAFRRGRESFRKNDVAGALPHFEQASGADPTNIEYALFAEWCREAVANPILTPTVSARLMKRAQAVLAHNPNCAFGYFVWGEALRFDGKSTEAREQLARALRLDPELLEEVRLKRTARRPSVPSGSHGLPQSPVPSIAPQPPPPQFMPLDVVSVPETPPARRPLPLRAVLVVVLILGAIGVAGLTAAALRRPNETPTAPVASASTTPTASSSAVAPAPSAEARQAPSAPLPMNIAPPAVDAGSTGTLVLSKSAIGHRRFIDGRVNESQGLTLEVPCGKHEVRIGSHGTSQVVDVPCGGRIEVR